MSGEKSVTKSSRTKKVWLLVTAMFLILVGYFGFRWMKGMLMLGYVDSAIVRMRALNEAEAKFAQANPRVGYTCLFSQLSRSGETQRLLSKNGSNNGYAFEIAGCEAPNDVRPNRSYYITARPLHPGQPAFCSDQSGVLNADYGGSVEKCRRQGSPL